MGVYLGGKWPQARLRIGAGGLICSDFSLLDACAIVWPMSSLDGEATGEQTPRSGERPDWASFAVSEVAGHENLARVSMSSAMVRASSMASWRSICLWSVAVGGTKPGPVVAHAGSAQANGGMQCNSQCIASDHGAGRRDQRANSARNRHREFIRSRRPIAAAARGCLRIRFAVAVLAAALTFPVTVLGFDWDPVHAGVRWRVGG